MKKFWNISLVVVLVIVTAFSMVACGPSTSGKSVKTGLSYKKEKDGGYVITSYGEEENVTELDLTTVLADKGITEKVRIKKNAFSGNSTLTKIVVPDIVTEIEEGAFANMSKLETLEVPFIGRTANSDMFFNESASSPDKAVESARTIAHFFGESLYDAGSKIVVNYSAKGSKTVYVPMTLNTVIVRATRKDNSGAEIGYSIPMYAFNGATNLTNIVLKGNIDGIGQSAFAGAVNVNTITLPATVKTIYENAFSGASRLSSLILDSNMASGSLAIKEGAFSGCKEISYIGAKVDNLPVNTVDCAKIDVASLGRNAFNFGKENVKFTVLNSSEDLSIAFGDQQINK